MSDEKELNDGIHAALCGNRLTSAVADFLTDLAARVRKLEKLSHVPVTFTEDENGFLRVAKPTTDSKGETTRSGGE